MIFGNYIEKVALLLRAGVAVGGLEVSDLSLKFARLSGKEWQLVNIKIPPGVIKEGKIENKKAFLEVLGQLRKQLPFKVSGRKRVSVVVSLASVNVYTQVISLPEMDEAKLGEAVRLNAQMASPVDEKEVHSDWQVVGKDEGARKVDILSAFVGKKIVDEAGEAFKEAGFLGVAFESRAMSLARVIREQAVGVDGSKDYVVVVLDNEALNFLVLRKGQLYFEYLNFWRDLQGGDKVISISDFRNAIVGNLRRVVNFYGQHWTGQVDGVMVLASGLLDEVKKVIRDNFPIPVKDLSLRLDKPISSDWFAVLGAGMRGIKRGKNDRDISLLGETAREEFRYEQFISFMRFWRVMIPAALFVLVAIFGGANVILAERLNELKTRTPSLNSDQVSQVEGLQSEALEFNRLIGLVKKARNVDKLKTEALVKLQTLLGDQQARISRFSFRDFDSKVTLYGEAPTRESILNLEKAMREDPLISQVELSLTEIKQTVQGFSFPISFSMASSKAE